MTTSSPIAVNISIPADLLNEVDLLLIDPFRGKPKYGARSQLITGLLVSWLEQQKDTADVRPADTSRSPGLLGHTAGTPPTADPRVDSGSKSLPGYDDVSPRAGPIESGEPGAKPARSARDSFSSSKKGRF